MTLLAWPEVAVMLGFTVLWRVDAFARRWDVGTALARRLAELELAIATKASAAELAAVREKLTQIQARLGQPK